MAKKLISIIIPVFNEEKNIPLVYKAINQVLDSLNKYDFEIIFINDGSQDKSNVILEKIAKRDQKVKFIEFSRNFGKEISLSAGLDFAKGEAGIMIDADLQHPTEKIPEFIEKWEKGAEVVVGVRQENKGEGLVKKIGSFFFYKIMNKISKTELKPYSTDYRLVDRKVIKEFRQFNERNRITRGLIDWLGFKCDCVYFKAPKRCSGEAGYNTLKLISLALNSFVSHSLFPLKLAGYLGIVITIFALILGLFILIEDIILDSILGLNFSGPFMVGVLLLFLIGIVLICLGLIALYIGNMHVQILDRPMYIIRKKKNID